MTLKLLLGIKGGSKPLDTKLMEKGAIKSDGVKPIKSCLKKPGHGHPTDNINPVVASSG